MGSILLCVLEGETKDDGLSCITVNRVYKITLNYIHYINCY